MARGIAEDQAAFAFGLLVFPSCWTLSTKPMPARTSGSRCAPSSRRPRACAMSFVREPAPFVTGWRSRTVANGLDHVRGAQLLPVFGGEVKEREEYVGVLLQSRDRLRVLGAVFGPEPMDAASFPPRATGRRLIRREDTLPGSRAPRSTTFGHTSCVPCVYRITPPLPAIRGRAMRGHRAKAQAEEWGRVG